MPTPSGCPSPPVADPAPSVPAPPALPVTGDPAADALLVEDPFALLIGMLVDQQFPIERAFAAPAALRRRIGAEHFSPAGVAALEGAVVLAAFVGPPALHRYPAVMAGRTAALARHLLEHHEGRAEEVWGAAADAEDLYRRLRALPGFGDEKTRIFIALLGKRFGVRPPGWARVSRPFSDDQPRSVADVASAEAFARVKEWKRAQRARGRSKED